MRVFDVGLVKQLARQPAGISASSQKEATDIRRVIATDAIRAGIVAVALTEKKGSENRICVWVTDMGAVDFVERAAVQADSGRIG